MMKRLAMGFGLLLLVMGAVVFWRGGPSASDRPPAGGTASPPYAQELETGPNRAALEAFIAARMTGPDGVYTNLQETGQSGESATGHEVLSESAGLLLRYYARTGQQERYEAEWKRTVQTFDSTRGFSYRYSPLHHKRYPVNAALDDLRIIRSLYEAAEAFPSGGYGPTADRYAERFAKTNLPDGYIHDFYDESAQTPNSFVTLAYIDLKALQLLPLSSKEREKATDRMLQIAKGGYLSSSFPFYQSRYDYVAQAYRTESVQTVESLYTILSLAEVQQQEPASIQYLKEHVKAGTLYGQYSKEGRPLNTIRSTAIYALTAMIGSVIRDRELYEASLKRMQEFQVMDTRNALYGGFADADRQQAFSFDNLTALLAYTY